MKTWSTYAFEELVDFHDHRRIPLSKKERSTRQGPYPYYGAQGVIDAVDDYIFDGKFLLIAEDGENLNSRKLPIAFFAEGQFWVNNHAHVVTARPGVADADFLRAYVEFHPLNGHITGAAQPKLSQGSLKRLPVTAPPFALQVRIGDAIRVLDGLIENHRRRVEILEEMARLIYREWFVHFRFRSREDVELVDSDLGPIPVGWSVTTLGEHAELERKSVKPADHPDEIFDHYSIPAFDEGQLPRVESGGDIKSGKYQVWGQRVLLSKLNPRVPRVWRANASQSERRSICSTEFLALAADQDWPATFVYAAVGDIDFGARLAQMAGGTSTSHQRVRPGDVMALPIVGPDARLAARYDEQVAPMLSLADKLIQQNKVLREVRDLLLPRLLSGELDVSELDLELAEAG